MNAIAGDDLKKAAVCAGIAVCGAAVVAAWCAPKQGRRGAHPAFDTALQELSRVLSMEWRDFTSVRIARILGALQALKAMAETEEQRARLAQVLKAASTTEAELNQLMEQHSAAVEKLVAHVEELEAQLTAKDARIEMLEQEDADASK